jgi:hypothetical protein
MRRILPMLGLLLASAAHAAVGDPCQNGVCPAGELCFPDDSGGYCTQRCPAEGCPDGYQCRNAEGVAQICVRSDGDAAPLPGLGEECGHGTGCADGLLCTQDGDAKYCSQPCAGPGTCPAGFRCASGDTPLCAKLHGLPGMGDVCADGMACAMGLVCTTHPSRSLPFCTVTCDGMCPDGFQCENGADGMRRCAPAGAQKPGFGEPCVPQAGDPALSGCDGALTCYVQGVTTYCTQDCDIAHACPAGYGCVRVAQGQGSCRRGQPDDPQFRDPGNSNLPPPPGGHDAAVPPPPGGGGDGYGDAGSGGGGGGGSSGCAIGPDAGAVWLLLPLLALRRRRR